MFDRHRKKAAVFFAAADVILLLAAFEAAYQLRKALPLELEFYLLTTTKALVLGFTFLAWLIVGWWMGVYQRLYARDTRAAVYDVFRQLIVVTLCLVAFQFALKLQISRVFIGLFGLFTLTLLLLYRVFAGCCAATFGGSSARSRSTSWWGPARTLSISDAASRSRAATASSCWPLSIFPIGLANRCGCPATTPVKQLGDLPEMLHRHVIDEVVFAVEEQRLSELEEILLLCDEEGVRTRVVVDFFPHVHSDVYLDHFGAVPLLTFSATPDDEIRLLLKRVFDIVLAAISLLVLAVPMMLLSLLVRLTSRGPAIFRQERCGLNGRRFVFYKFRSMVENADKQRQSLEHLNEKDGPVFKIANDPRLTLLGHYLRRFSIDEWPQFWNVLKGDMSFVGPRPAVPGEVEQYAAWQRRRLRMRPGLTCLWAIRGRDRVDFDTWMKLDLEYIDNWSLWLDLKILLHSIPRVVAGRGAN